MKDDATNFQAMAKSQNIKAADMKDQFLSLAVII